MSENKITQTKKSFSLDWLMRGVLTKLGETFDKLTGRNWKPSSSLATSELAERLKLLLDAEAKDAGGNKRFVPHNIKLKMQWDKFSTDAEKALVKLENELLIAAVDHINDKRYHTYAPIELEIKPDYFTEGVKLLASFDKFGDDAEHEAAINVSVPDLKNVVINPQPEIPAEPEREIFAAEFSINGAPIRKELAFEARQRRSVGRTKENDLRIDDASVSKIHAALVLNSDNQLMVADTGSTNGTFVNGERIAYGKAIPIKDGDRLKFGSIDVALKRIVKEVEQQQSVEKENAAPTEILSAKNVLEDEESTAIETAVMSENRRAADSETVSPTVQRVVLDFGENE